MADLSRVAGPAPLAGFYALLSGKLGISNLHSGEDLASLVEKRLPAATVKALIQTSTRGGLSDAEVYQAQ